LVPQNDRQRFLPVRHAAMVPYLLGKAHPEGTRIADSQKAFRSGDIER